MFASESRPTVSLPRPPESAPARRFPVIATLAPIVASAVLFAVTRSAYTLVFAMLGPIVAIATTADAAIHRRRTAKAESARFERELDEAETRISSAHADERRRLERDAEAAGLASVTLGVGPRPSALRMDPGGLHAAGAEPRLDDLRARAAVVTRAPITGDASTGIGVVGPAVLAGAAARAILLRLVATALPLSRVVAPGGHEWDWLGKLPVELSREGKPGIVTIERDGSDLSLCFARSPGELPLDPGIVLMVSGSGVAEWGSIELEPNLIGIESAGGAANRLREDAAARGIQNPRSLPQAVELADLVQTGAPGLAATIGETVDEPLVIDLVTDGPHAIVGGTTGSGKSELLVSWVLAMAAERSPGEVTFLFVDFKGGAAFDPLLGLPHSVGVITDLDAEQSLRALASLGAELRHRERELARFGLRSIDACDEPPFPRLVVVVDEYAALVETHSSLHGVFADIAARGRSLGVHLVLCTQRPAGVVRDGILANCALRISLRVMAAADSTAVLGTDAAAVLPARPVGRALVAAAGERPRAFQVARSRTEDAERIIGRWADSVPPRRPWLPPLAPVIALETPGSTEISDSIETPGSNDAADGIPFGLADLPERQAQEPARYRPGEQGSLLVVGAARSGKSALLVTLTAAAGGAIVAQLLPRELPQLWDALETAAGASEASDSTARPERLLLLDDLDATIAACDENYRAALVDRLAGLLRDGPAIGVHLVIAVQRITGPLQPLVGLCGARLILRMPDRQEHALAGGAAAEFRETMPPGAGHWQGHRVQVFLAPQQLAATTLARATTVDPGGASLAVVSTRPEEFATRLRAIARVRRVIVLGRVRIGVEDATHASLEGAQAEFRVPDILVGDPDAWQSQWALLGTLQRSGDVLFDGCSLADLRAITRSRELPPPFARGERTLWLRHPDGEVLRARLGA